MRCQQIETIFCLRSNQENAEGNNVFRYNIKDNKVDKMKSLETLEKVFYLDEKSENVYRFNGKIGKIKLKNWQRRIS